MAYAGIAARQMKLRNMNGIAISVPISWATRFSSFFLSRQLVERKIAQQAADGIRDFRRDLAVADDDLAAAELGAAVYRQAISSKLSPRTMMLWLSWPTEGGHCRRGCGIRP